MYFSTKGISTSVEGVITDIDPASGTIKGYFSVFGNKDSDEDVIMPGAFTKTLQENGSRIRHVWQHNISQPLARPKLFQDSKGLAFESVISKTNLGKDVILLYEDGVIDEHSIGYRIVKAQRVSDYNELRELRLWEGSSVTLGANELALGGPSKSLTEEQLIKRMDQTYKALRNGRYESEEIFELLDVYHQQLKQLFHDLVSTRAVSNTPEPTDEQKSDNSEIDIKLNSLIGIFQ